MQINNVTRNVLRLNLTKGYNYFDKSNIGNIIVNQGDLPCFVNGSNAQISVDVSTGSKYSDYTFKLDSNNNLINIAKMSSSNNWRFYAKIYYDNELSARFLNLTNNQFYEITGLTIFQGKHYNTTIKHSSIQMNTTNIDQTIPKSIIFDSIIVNISNYLNNLFESSNPNKTFVLDFNNNPNLAINLLISQYDTNNCISNCSNNGFCKFKKDKFICKCDSNYDGPKCEIDLRPCSYSPCLNFDKCENIQNGTLLIEETGSIRNIYSDFKCHCKSDLYYGKRCENKINLCHNETCSGNGVCKLIGNELFMNETTKCECFGQGEFEGEKCKTKTQKMVARETKIKFTYIIAIVILISLYLLIISSDLHNIFIIKIKKQATKK